MFFRDEKLLHYSRLLKNKTFHCNVVLTLMLASFYEVVKNSDKDLTLCFRAIGMSKI